MANEREIARRLLELFGENGEHWLQHAFARNTTGQCASESPAAIAWCLSGAMSKLGMNYEVLRPALIREGFDNFIVFNDASTWPQVRGWLQETAGIGEEEAAEHDGHYFPVAESETPPEEVVQEILADGSMRMMSAKKAKKWRRSLKTKIRNESGTPQKEDI